MRIKPCPRMRLKDLCRLDERLDPWIVVGVDPWDGKTGSSSRTQEFGRKGIRQLPEKISGKLRSDLLTGTQHNLSLFLQLRCIALQYSAEQSNAGKAVSRFVCGIVHCHELYSQALHCCKVFSQLWRSAVPCRAVHCRVVKACVLVVQRLAAYSDAAWILYFS